MRTVFDLIKQHPGFDPKTQTDLPTIEEIWAANTMTEEEFYKELARDRAASDAGRREAERGRQERSGEELQRRVLDSGIPSRYVGVPIDITHKLDGGRGLYVMGGTDSERTERACAILKGYLSTGWQSAEYVTSSLLMTNLSGGDPDGRAVARYARCGLLVIDGMGRENPTEGALSLLWQIVDSRHGDMSPIVVTTQYGTDDLTRMLSRNGGEQNAKAIVERIREACSLVKVG